MYDTGCTYRVRRDSFPRMQMRHLWGGGGVVLHFPNQFALHSLIRGHLWRSSLMTTESPPGPLHTHTQTHGTSFFFTLILMKFRRTTWTQKYPSDLTEHFPSRHWRNKSLTRYVFFTSGYWSNTGSLPALFHTQPMSPLVVNLWGTDQTPRPSGLLYVHQSQR